MKRVAEDRDVRSPVKQSRSGSSGASASSSALLAAAASSVVAELLAHAPALAAPPPRKVWGLDRLVLDDRCGEASVREALLAGGSSLLEPPVPGRPCAEKFLTDAPILSLPGGIGQGFAVAVGLSIGQEHMTASYKQPGFELFNHRVFVLCRSGALLPCVTSEAASLAGHLRLASLVAIACDDGLGGGKGLAQRYASYGWSVDELDISTPEALRAALAKTRVVEAPTLLLLRGIPHGESAAQEEACREAVRLGTSQGEAWAELFRKFGEQNREAHTELVRRFADGKLPDNWRDDLPEYTVGERAQATRQYSAKVLASLVTAIPEMVGGSADLTGSNLTNQAQLKDFQHKRQAGRYLRFGVREHGMLGICTGLSAYGCFIPFCSTFMNFFTYGWGAIRLACAARAHVIYVATHDSIELGEDGPTHQPIEVLAACRALPNLLTIRPADGPETVGAYTLAVQSVGRPVLIALCRNGTPHLQGADSAKVAKGGYILEDFDPALSPLVVLASSGTEVALCVEVRAALQAIGIGVRVVSMPCWELFEEQPAEYRRAVFEHPRDGTPLPAGMRPLRAYVEASSTLGFSRYSDLAIGMTTFGASADGKTVRKFFGFEKLPVATKVMEALKDRGHVVSYRLGRFGLARFSPPICAAAAE
mmetsp:Transcript_5548/g.20957  ORF Transcript_5548/g.20957 Transcript_5548/m.20957 type:complete len:650 (-) Transcript_5548:303-2252(-)